MPKGKSNNKGLQARSRGTTLSVYFPSESLPMLDRLSQLAQSGKIASMSAFISEAARHAYTKRKDLSQ